MKRGVVEGLVGLFCAVLWLGILLLSDFNALAVSAGLLAGLYLTGKPSRRHLPI